MSKEKEVRPQLSSGWGLIEKAQELRWTLQFAIAVLFADIILTWRTGHGIKDWSIDSDQLLTNSGFLITSILAFGLVMSMIMPVIGELIRQLGWAIPWPTWFEKYDQYRRPSGYITATELYEQALISGDAAMLEMSLERKEQCAAELISALETGHLAFFVLVLSFVNLSAEYVGVSGQTLIQYVSSEFGDGGKVFLTVMAFLDIAIIKKNWFSYRQRDWIYHPPLYKKIIEEKEKYQK